MLDLYLTILIYFFAFGLFGWVLSLALKNVTHVDSMWALFPSFRDACLYSIISIKHDAGPFFLFNSFMVFEVICIPNEKKLGKTGRQ